MAIDAAAIAYGAGAVIMAVERWLSGAPKARECLPSVIASRRWEYAPLILLIIAAAIWIARFGFWPHLLEWRWRPISAESPLADKALKWSLQASLRLQSASYRNKCQAVIVHNSSAYSQ